MRQARRGCCTSGCALRFVESRPARLPPPPTIQASNDRHRDDDAAKRCRPAHGATMPRWDWRGRCSRFACMRWAVSRRFRRPTGDNDSLLRLVEIRDLIGGQGWFDLHQYRMGPQGGFVMHWSRLVDAPIAAIILVVSALTGKLATGETVALFAWTTLLMAAALAFMLRIARAVGDDWALMPALIICTAALHFGGVFAPGDIDHHNVQLTLTLAAMTALIVGRSHVAGIAAGAACALMLAVGMETLPYVAVAGLTASAGLFAGRARRGGQGGRVRDRLCRRWLRRLPCDRAGQRLARALMRRLLAPAILGRGDFRTWPGSGGGFSRARPQLRRKARRIAGARCRGCRPRSNCFPAMPRRPLCRTGSEVAAILARPCDRGAAFLERAHP